MAHDRFALVFWVEDQQYSVVEHKDIVGEVQLNETVPVAWRVKKKGRAVTTWHEAKIIQFSDNEESLQLLCDNYAEQREMEINNVAGKKRKRTKTPKGKELDLAQTSTCSPDEGVTIPSAKRIAKTLAEKCNKAAGEKNKKNKTNKEQSLKATQLESAKIMAKEVIEATLLIGSKETSLPGDSSSGKNNLQILEVHDTTEFQTSPSTNSQASDPTTPQIDVMKGANVLLPNSPLEELPTISSPSTQNQEVREQNFSKAHPVNCGSSPLNSVLQPSSSYSTPVLNPSQQKRILHLMEPTQSRDSSPYARSTPTTTMPNNSNDIASKPDNRGCVINSQPLQLSRKSNMPCKSNRDASRELTFHNSTDRPTSTLSSELNNAICLSYDCDDWQNESEEWRNECDEVQIITPTCQCAELRAENERLKSIISNLKREKNNFTGMPKASPSTISFLESLAKYLRGDCQGSSNVETMSVAKTSETFALCDLTNVKTPRPSSYLKSGDGEQENQTPSPHYERGDGKQELCPGTGVFIPTLKLRQNHHKGGADLKVLFHLLMDHFFSEETLAQSVAFGSRVLPTGKKVLDPNIVSAIKGYLLASAKIFNVPPLDNVKLNKMFTNKCTAAQTKFRKKLTAITP